MRRLMLLAAASLGLAASAAAQNVVRVQVGGELAGRLSQQIDVPVTADMRQSGGALLGAYRVRISWDPTVLSFGGINVSSFGQGTVATDSVGLGIMRVGGLQPAGVGGIVTLFTLTVSVITDTTTSPITIVVEDMVAAGSFTNLLPITQVTSGTFCRSLGRWGDTDDDGRTDSRDALIALSYVVGLVDTLEIDTLSTTPFVTDTTRATLADVDGDGAVTSRDALIILSNSVGLPVTGFRIGLTAAGVCATGAATTLVILPDTIDLEVGQLANVQVQARDATGRVVPVPNITWRTSDGTIAALAGPAFGDVREAPLPAVGQPMAMSAPASIEGRGPGTAVLTAEAGPGLRTTMVVQVMARRRVWYVNVMQGLDAPTQTGSLRYPFGRINDAMSAAQNGDTLRVAPGVYHEAPSEYEALHILGDPANRPIVDPRGTGYTSGMAMFVGNPLGKTTVSHMVFRVGGLYMEGHDNEVRKVRFENIGQFDYALEIYSEGVPQPTGPVTGPPGVYGNVLIDSVDVVGPRLSDALVVDQADTVIVRNTTVTGDSVRTSCFTNALAVYESQYIRVHDSQFTNLCGGFYLWTTDNTRSARIELSRNRIIGFSQDAVELASPVIRMDHNVIRRGRSQFSRSNSGQGVHVRSSFADSVSLLGDSIVDVPYRGVFIDSANVATIDSVTIDSTGQDTSFAAHGIYLQSRGSFAVRHSRIRNVMNGDGIQACDRSVLRTRGNVIRAVGGVGVNASLCFDIAGPDTVIMDRDTIDVVSAQGVSVNQSRFVRLDSVRVDSATSSALTLSGNRVEITGSDLRRSQDGMQVVADTFKLTGTTIDLVGFYGVLLQSTTDTARISNTTINASQEGLYLTNAVARIDSARITNALGNGLRIGSGSGARVRRARLTGNALGIRLDPGALPSVIRQSMIAGNLNLQGVANNAGSLAPLDADTNWWGDAAGPACAPVAGTCAASAGDSILTTDVTFAAPLGAPPAVPAPPAFGIGQRPAARAAAPAVMAQPGATRVDQVAPSRAGRRTVPRSRSGQAGSRN